MTYPGDVPASDESFELAGAHDLLSAETLAVSSNAFLSDQTIAVNKFDISCDKGKDSDQKLYAAGNQEALVRKIVIDTMKSADYSTDDQQ